MQNFLFQKRQPKTPSVSLPPLSRNTNISRNISSKNISSSISSQRRGILGFTLVEIMIVIAMIGILAASLFPNMTGYLKRARDAARASDLNNIATGIAAYEINKETLPPHVSGCYPSQALLSRGYTKKDFISPSGSGYDEGCGTGGRYAYGVSTGNVLDPQSSLLIAMMENWNGGNYTGSTSGMTGDLTLLGHFNATFLLSRGTGSIYILRPSAGSGGTAGSPPPAAINGVCNLGVPGLCSPGTPSNDNPGVCGGSRTWTCNGQYGGSSASCTYTNGACPANVTATFDGNGGAFHFPTSKIVAYNTAIGTLPSNPVRSGYAFIGWFTATTGGTQISINTLMTANTTYYAQWDCDVDGISYPACTARGQAYTATSTYPGCDTPDKVICSCEGNGRVWSMCNVGSTIAGTGVVSYGSLFQWGRNVPFPSTGSVPTIVGPLDITSVNATTSYITVPNVPPYQWLTPWDDNLWGGSGTTSNSGTYLSATPGNQALMRGSCEPGYHIPTVKEWCDIINSIYNTNSCSDTSNIYTFINLLKLPFANVRGGVDGAIYNPYSLYGSSSNNPYSYAAKIYIQQISTSSLSADGIGGAKSMGYSIRCMKN